MAEGGRLRVCMVFSRHTLDDARVVHKEAETLRAAGHQVTLLSSCNERHEYTRFDGKVIASGTAAGGEALYQGFRVVGRPKRKGIAGKWRTLGEMSALAADLEADVYHAHEPDLALAIAIRAKAILRRMGKRALVVHDMHEYPPGETVDVTPGWLRPAAHAALRAWDRWMAREVDHIFTANSIVRGYALQSLSRHIPADILYNGPALRLFPQRPPERWAGPGEALVLCHEGSLGLDRGLREMVEVVDRLRERVRLRIVGDVFGAERDWLDDRIASRGLEEVITRTGWLPYTEVGEAVRCSHAGLILFRDCLVNTLAGPPNKLFNYMNAGLPVLGMGFPEMRRIILEERCGVLVEDQTVNAIVRGVETLLASPGALAEMGDAGQRAIRERYSWERMEPILLSAYDDLARSLGGR